MTSPAKRTPIQKQSHSSDSSLNDSVANVVGDSDDHEQSEEDKLREAKLRRKIDLRLCTLAGLLASLDLLDSGIISSASVTTMFADLDLGVGNRYSVSIFIFTLASIAFQLPSTIAVRYFGPRIWFSVITFAFGIITLATAFVQTWKQMIGLRILLGISMSGIYPGLTYLISTWYTREEQQLRFAYLQTGEVFILATGGFVNYGLNQLNGRHGLAGWRWMFIVQGSIAAALGIVTYFWMVDFPEKVSASRFLNEEEAKLAVDRIQRDRKDVIAAPFTWKGLFAGAGDIKVYGFACMFFLLNLVSTALSYFLPIILSQGMGFSSNQAILLAAPPYYWAILPVILSSWVSDRFRLRGPVIVFNSFCMIAGIAMLGFAQQPTVRYIGTFLATGAYVSNWAALSAYYANNIAGQWKRVFTAAIVTAMNGAGGIAGSYIFKQNEAPRYQTATWVALGSHILMIVFVLLFTAGFYHANSQQGLGKRLIEGTSGFRHTY